MESSMNVIRKEKSMTPQLFNFHGQPMGETIETKKEPIKAPIKIDKESAQKSLINFRQSLKKIRSHL